MDKNILLCGVGGQGTVLAAKLIASAAMRMGETAHSAETIGMAQRGGSVTSHVRIGEGAGAPLIPSGKADIILAFEPGEALRNLPYLKKDGVVVVNSVPVKPVTESLSDTGYDGRKEIEYIRSICGRVIEVDAKALCQEIGSSKVFNIAILGVAVGTGVTGLDQAAVMAEIEEKLPAKFIELNKEAFNKGMDLAKKY